MNVGLGIQSHLKLLNFRRSAQRKQHRAINIGAPFDSRDGGRARVARRCAEYGHAGAFFSQSKVEEVTKKLQGDVFERECRAVKQLEDLEGAYTTKRCDASVSPPGYFRITGDIISCDNGGVNDERGPRGLTLQ